MPRNRTFERDEIACRAMQHYWRKGFHAASIRELIAATGLNRKALYDEFDGKEGLYAAALKAYVNEIVTPAFAQVENRNATLVEIDKFFTTQINRGMKMGTPGPGCFMANTMTESAPHVAVFRDVVDDHLSRLRRGFANALKNEAAARDLKNADIKSLADFLTISAQGLWSYARHARRKSHLVAYKNNLLHMIDTRLSNG